MAKGRIALFVLALVAASLQLTGIASAANGTISGTLSRASGGTVGSMQVYASAWSAPPGPGNGSPVGFGATNGSGQYSMALPAGTYRIMLSANAGAAVVSGWLGTGGSVVGSFDEASQHTVVDDTALTGRNATMPTGGGVRGTVSGPNGPVAANDVTLRVYPASATDVGSFHYTAQTQADGTYEVTGIPLGSYKILFHVTGPVALASKWAGGAAVIGEAQPFSVGVDAGNQNRITVNETLAVGASISGIVRGPDGAPVGQNDVCVQAFSVILGAQSGDIRGHACTDANGAYTMSGLNASSPQNRVRVQFFPVDDGSPLNVRGEWYDDRASYETANVVEATVAGTTGIDATLSAGAPAISGVVRRASDSSTVGANQVCVEALVNVPGADWGENAGGTCTGADGSWRLLGLSSGQTYRIRYHAQPGSNLSGAWHGPSATSYATAAPVSPGTTGLTVLLGSGFSISGTVSAGSGDPVGANSVCVSAFLDVPGGDFGPWVNGTCVNAGGGYVLAGLSPGTYRIEFSARPGSGLSTRWSGGAARYSNASTVTIAGSNLTNQNISLPVGAVISGTISGPSGPVGLGAVCIVAHTVVANANWGEFVAATCTESNGTYQLSGLAPGSYKLLIQPNQNQPSGLKAEWYDDAATYAQAIVVTTSVASPATGINAALGAGVSISGTVSGPNGPVGQGHVCVSAMTVVVGATWGEHVIGTCTNGAGQYALTGLPPGSYKLVFEARPGSGLQSRFLGGVTKYEQSTPVDASTSLTGINMTLTSGAAITGTVNGPGGPVAQNAVCVSAITIVPGAYNGDHVGGACTRSDGTFSIGGIAPGSYRLIYHPQSGSSLRGAWSGNATTYETATAVATGTATSITLAAGGAISGVVYQPGSGSTPTTVGANQVCVSAFEHVAGAHWGQWAGGACTNAAGEYTIAGLAAGSQYRIEFRPQPGSSLKYEWYSDKRSYDQATPVSVGTTGLNATLDTGTSISGVVSGGGGPVGAGDVCVGAFTIVVGGSWGEMAGGACTNAAGAYSIDGLTTGVSYKLIYQAQPQSTLISRWSGNDSTYQDADAVAAPNATANITLAAGGSISGTVSSGSGPVAGQAVCVSAFTADGSLGSWGVWRGGTCTRADGTYTIAGLPTGEALRLRFEPQIDSLAGEWWNDASTYATATTVTAPAIGRDATLASGGEITAPVTWAAGGSICVAARPNGGGGDSWRSASCLVAAPGATTTLRLTGLPAGSYEVVVWDSSAGATSAKWYAAPEATNALADASYPGTRSLVTVTNGSAVTLETITF